MRFDRNPDYWRKGRPYLDRIVARFIADSATRTAAMEKGEAHMGGFAAIPWSDVKALAKLPQLEPTTKGYEMSSPIVQLDFNTRRPPFDNLKSRQAVAYAVNRKFVIDNVWFGWGKPATGPISSNFAPLGFYTNEVKSYNVPNGIEIANKLLDEAGLKRGADGVRAEIVHDLTPYGEEWQRYGEYVQQALAEIGIKATLRYEDVPTWLKRLYTDYDFQLSSNWIQGLAIPVVCAILVLNFLLLRLAPGDAASVLAGEAGSATPEYMAELRQRFGLDQPLLVQLLYYVKNMAALDLGFSFRYNMPVLTLIVNRLGPTLLLMGVTLVLSVGAGVTLGILAASRAGSWRDTLISILALVSYATPLFWIGLMLVVVFSLKLDWLPTSGMETVAAFYQGSDRVLDIARHLILPAVTLSLFYMALYTRLMRAAMLEQAGMDYVTTARAKGVSEGRITLAHVVRNAVLPVVTVAGVQLGGLLGGSIVVESVFAWPGLGFLAFQALFARDFNLLLGIFFLSASLVVVVNLGVDLLYTFLDPRIQV